MALPHPVDDAVPDGRNGTLHLGRRVGGGQAQGQGDTHHCLPPSGLPFDHLIDVIRFYDNSPLRYFIHPDALSEFQHYQFLADILFRENGKGPLEDSKLWVMFTDGRGIWHPLISVLPSLFFPWTRKEVPRGPRGMVYWNAVIKNARNTSSLYMDRHLFGPAAYSSAGQAHAAFFYQKQQPGRRGGVSFSSTVCTSVTTNITCEPLTKRKSGYTSFSRLGV